MIQKRKQKTLTKQKKSKPAPSELTFIEHFYELRTRLFWVVLSLVVTSALGFQYKDQLIAAVMEPLHGEKLVYLTPAGGFSFIFTLSIYFGVLLSIPVIIYQIYRFLKPLLGNASRRLVSTLMLLSVLLAGGGAAFGYYVTIPAAINFLSNFAGDAVIPSLTAESYLNFVVTYVLGLAALFQLPLLLFLFDSIRPIPPGALSSTQRFVIIGATIVAAVITPTPDAFNMMIVAIPIILIYELGAFAVFIRHRLQRRHPITDQTVIDMPIGLVQQSPLTEVIVSTVQPQEVIRNQQITHLQKKTIDGMVMTRRAPTVVAVPSRPVTTPARLVSQRPAAGRQLRSIDGMVTA